MAKYSSELVRVLEKTAQRLRSDLKYQWGHMGMCNCGHLAQEITGIDKGRIHQSALQREGDWEVQIREYCPTSGLLIDDIITAMLDLGFDRQDIGNLERLADPQVLKRLPLETRHALQRNNREHVAAYIEAWVGLLTGGQSPATPDLKVLAAPTASVTPSDKTQGISGGEPAQSRPDAKRLATAA